MSEEEKREFLFTWKIKHFNFFGKIYCECLSSPVFRVESLEDSEWKISIFPRTVSEDLECRLQRISKESSKNENIVVNFRYQLASSNGVVLKTSDVFSQTFQEGSCSETYRLIELNDLIKEILKYPEDILIFRCYMSNSYESMSQTSGDAFMTDCEVETDISCRTPSYVWSFKFSNVDDWSVSKQIKSDNIRIEIIFKYMEEKINIELLSTAEDEWTHHFTCDIELINAIGNQVAYGEGDYEFNDENRIWKFPSFISKQHLEQAQCFLREEIRVKFYILHLYSFISKINYCSNDLASGPTSVQTKNKTYTSIPETDSSKSSKTDCLLYYSQHHFQNSSFDESSTDAILRVSNEVFHAHKSLLAEKSPVFSQMFVQDVKNNSTDIIDVNDIETGTLKYFLEYIYTGIVNGMDVEMALDLLEAAERYQVVSLEKKCSSFLEKNLSPTNVCRVLYMADMINHAHLKSYVLDYIVVNSCKILSSPEWSYWVERNTHLATEVFLKLSKTFDSQFKSDQV